MKRKLILTLAIVLSAGVARADLTILSRVTSSQGQPTTLTQYLGAAKMRTSDPAHDTLFDFGSQTITFIDHKKKEYWETTVAEMQANFARLAKQMESMPFGMGAAGEVTVKHLKDAKKIAGYDCEHAIISMGDSMTFDVWSAPALSVPQGYFEAGKASYAAMGPMGARFEKIYEAWKTIKGFPLSVSTSYKIMTMKVDSVSEATEVSTAPISAGAFALPAGYTKRDSPLKQKQR